MQSGRFKRVMTMLGKLHRDEGGGDMVEKLLIIAAIVLPLLGLLFLFRDTINNWVGNAWSTVANDADFAPTNLSSP